jgi:hypothetical protein
MMNDDDTLKQLLWIDDAAMQFNLTSIAKLDSGLAGEIGCRPVAR